MEARKQTASAMSWAEPKVPRAMLERAAAWAASLISPLPIRSAAMPSVSIPGPTQLARTPKRPSSLANARTRASTAPFGPDDRTSRLGKRRVAQVVTATRLPIP